MYHVFFSAICLWHSTEECSLLRKKMKCVVVLGDMVLLVGATGTIEKIEECGMTEVQSEAVSLKSA